MIVVSGTVIRAFTDIYAGDKTGQAEAQHSEQIYYAHKHVLLSQS